MWQFRLQMDMCLSRQFFVFASFHWLKSELGGDEFLWSSRVATVNRELPGISHGWVEAECRNPDFIELYNLLRFVKELTYKLIRDFILRHPLLLLINPIRLLVCSIFAGCLVSITWALSKVQFDKVILQVYGHVDGLSKCAQCPPWFASVACLPAPQWPYGFTCRPRSSWQVQDNKRQQPVRLKPFQC